jgi:hypothetical protein
MLSETEPSPEPLRSSTVRPVSLQGRDCLGLKQEIGDVGEGDASAA